MSEFFILSAAEYIVDKRPNRQISKAMLESTLYFIQEEFIKETGAPLFRENFVKSGTYPKCIIIEQFENGTVYESQLSEFRRKFSAGKREIMDRVADRLKDSNSMEILEMIEKDIPWNETKENKVVSHKAMRDAFSHKGEKTGNDSP